MRSLRSILLVNLGLLTAAALVLVSLSAALVALVDRSAALWVAMAYGAGSLLVFAGFGGWLVRRALLDPLAELSRTAEALAKGETPAPVRSHDYRSREMDALEERFRQMAARLLDAQGQVVRAEKLAAIGRLGAGLAHEIRNPLGALNTYVEVLKQRGVGDDVVTEMQHEVARMDRIVAGLLDYARPRPGARIEADLPAAARATVEFLTKQGALKGHGVELVADPGVSRVMADRHDLEQILVNLILNARDACPGGKIVIGVHRHRPGARRRYSDEHDSAGARRDAAVPPVLRSAAPEVADGTLLVVADEGPGVAEGDRERVFDPFYTTKDTGEGTGLGLAIVARAAHDAGGVVWVDRAREGGAVFKVLFPPAPEGM